MRFILGIFLILFFLITSYLIFSPGPSPYYSAEVSADSWSKLFISISIPRFLQSIFVSIPVVLISYILVFKKKFSIKSISSFLVPVALIIGITFGFFIWIFPKEILSIRLPAPSSTYKSVYRYGAYRGGSASDSASVTFYSNQSFDEIVNFYTQSSEFQSFRDRGGEVKEGDLFIATLKNGKSVNTSISRDKTDQNVSVIHFSVFQ